MVSQRVLLGPLGRRDPERIGCSPARPARVRFDGSGLPGQVAAGRLVAVKTIRPEYAEEADFRAGSPQEVAAARGSAGCSPPRSWRPTRTPTCPGWPPRTCRRPRWTPRGSVRSAAGAGRALAGCRLRGGARVHPRRRAGAPRSEAVQRAGLAGRAARDRLRGGPRGGADPAHHHPRRGGDPGVHGAEQARDTRQAIVASDVFSLGSTLLFAACGHARTAVRR